MCTVTVCVQLGNVSEEMRDLLARVTELQREKWELEERVGHAHTRTHTRTHTHTHTHTHTRTHTHTHAHTHTHTHTLGQSSGDDRVSPGRRRCEEIRDYQNLLYAQQGRSVDPPHT